MDFHLTRTLQPNLFFALLIGNREGGGSGEGGKKEINREREGRRGREGRGEEEEGVRVVVFLRVRLSN